MYKASPDEDKVSRSTLMRAWNVTWKKVMRFRNVGQGKRCKHCARLDEERRSAMTDDEKSKVRGHSSRLDLCRSSSSLVSACHVRSLLHWTRRLRWRSRLTLMPFMLIALSMFEGTR